MFEGFLPIGSEYGGYDPLNGRAVGVPTAVSLRAVVGSVPALPYPCVGSDVMEIKIVGDARCYPNSPAPFPCSDLLHVVSRVLFVAPWEG